MYARMTNLDVNFMEVDWIRVCHAVVYVREVVNTMSLYLVSFHS